MNDVMMRCRMDGGARPLMRAWLADDEMMLRVREGRGCFGERGFLGAGCREEAWMDFGVMSIHKFAYQTL